MMERPFPPRRPRTFDPRREEEDLSSPQATRTANPALSQAALASTIPAPARTRSLVRAAVTAPTLPVRHATGAVAAHTAIRADEEEGDDRSPPQTCYSGFTRITAGDQALVGRLETLGVGGLRVSASASLPLGANVMVRFVPPHSSAAVTVPCTVLKTDRITTGWLYGLCFGELPLLLQHEIALFVEAMATTRD